MSNNNTSSLPEKIGFTKYDMEAAFAEGVHAGVSINDLPTPRTRFKEWMQKRFPELINSEQTPERSATTGLNQGNAAK